MTTISVSQTLLVLLAQGTETDSLVHILTVVIMLAVVLIGNIAQAKTQKKPRRRRHPDEPPPGDYDSDQALEQTLDLPKRTKPRPYAPGGFREVLEEESEPAAHPRVDSRTAFDRFLEMKNVPVEQLERSPVTAIADLDVEEDPGEQLEHLERLDIQEEAFEIAGVGGSDKVFEEEELAVGLSFDNLEDAILYSEILGPPVGMGGASRLVGSL